MALRHAIHIPHVIFFKNNLFYLLDAARGVSEYMFRFTCEVCLHAKSV